MIAQEINLPDLIERFGSEDKCRDYLTRLRWPNGIRCPRCDNDSVSHIRERHQWDCNSCRYQFSVRAGTLFHDSKLPLWKWFLAVYLMVESKKGISANQVKRMIGVSYKTAWYLCHRIRACMTDDGKLEGIVEVDETYVGGKVRGKGQGYKGNKTVVLGAIQRGGPVRIRVNRSAFTGKPVLHGFVNDVTADHAEAIHTDELPAYKGIGDEDTRHETVNHGQYEWVRGDVHTNSVESVWSLVKRSIVGSYHQVSTKHLQSYADERAFVFNNRENPNLFRDTLRNLLAAERLSYQELISPDIT